MTKVYAPLGEISFGTLRDEDLLGSFSDALNDLIQMQDSKAVRESYTKLFDDVNACLDGLAEHDLSPSREEELRCLAADLIDELSDALNDFAPPYAYFGTNEGDGASFGFWICDDALTEAENTGEVRAVFIGKEIPEGDSEYVLWIDSYGHSKSLIERRTGQEVW